MPRNDGTVTMTSQDRLISQYEAPPAAGMTRFWMSIESWMEEWPDNAPFFFWQSGQGGEYRLRPSVIGTPEAEGLPPLGVATNLDDETFDRMFISNGMVCMLVDAPDEAGAWETVRRCFPDMRERFIGPATSSGLGPEKTLSSLCRNGRFQHPNPPEEPSEERPSSTLSP